MTAPADCTQRVDAVVLLTAAPVTRALPSMIDTPTAEVEHVMHEDGLITAVSVVRASEAVVRVSGEVDVRPPGPPRDGFLDAWGRTSKPVAVDLEGVTFFGAAGVGALIEAHAILAAS